MNYMYARLIADNITSTERIIMIYSTSIYDSSLNTGDILIYDNGIDGNYFITFTNSLTNIFQPIT